MNDARESIPMRRKRSSEQLRRAARQGFDCLAGINGVALAASPCDELFQIIHEQTPVNWLERWRVAGGRVFEGRMIALKTDPIWMMISDFGLPYPPFDEYDIMAVRDIGYTESRQMGFRRIDQVAEERIWAVDLLQLNRQLEKLNQ